MIAAKTLWEAVEQVARVLGVPLDDALDGTLAELRTRGATIQFDSGADCWRATLPTR
jgi:hypothetical protein